MLSLFTDFVFVALPLVFIPFQEIFYAFFGFGIVLTAIFIILLLLGVYHD